MAERLTSLRPPPRLKTPLSYANVEAGLSACGVSLLALRTDRGRIALPAPTTARDARILFDAILEPRSVRLLSRLDDAATVAAASWVALALANTIAEASARAAERTEAMVQGMEAPWDALFRAFQAEGAPPDPDRVVLPEPAFSVLASEGYAAWRDTRRAPFAEVLLFLADVEVAQFFSIMREAERKARAEVRTMQGVT